MIKVQSK